MDPISLGTGLVLGAGSEASTRECTIQQETAPKFVGCQEGPAFVGGVLLGVLLGGVLGVILSRVFAR